MPEQSLGHPLCVARRHVAATLQQELDEIVEAAAGTPCLLTCATALAERVAALSELHGEGDLQTGACDRCPASDASSSADRAPPPPPVLWRTLYWFHHIKSPAKRRVIVAAARELGIGGFCKVGYPGVIVAEGARDALLEYGARLRALRWSAMSVRGEEPGSTERALPAPLEELPADDMGLLAARCRACGVEALFLSALKLDR